MRATPPQYNNIYADQSYINMRLWLGIRYRTRAAVCTTDALRRRRRHREYTGAG